MLLYPVAIIFILTVGLTPAFALMNDKTETIGYWDKQTIDVALSTSYKLDHLAEVTEAVTSTEFYTIEDNLMHKMPPGYFSDYYLGWQGALDNANATNIKLDFAIASYGDIIISLTNQRSPDGHAGTTWFVYDGSIITKAYITIYNVDKISNAQLYSIVMHEMGHALGIGHTTADEDVMYEKRANVPYPYVSPCVMQALEFAYTEGKGQVTCLK